MSEAMQRLERMLAELPARIAQAQQQAADLAASAFAGESSDGSASATVDGAGQLVGVALSPSLAPRLDNLTLSERIAEAINSALEAAEVARDELVASGASGGDLTDELAGAEQMFDYRMSELERTVDQLESRLRDLPG